ncbi:MAG: hypothetical protein HN341_05120 [Verrucomicrobia bacterium]|nr:hypothetical protein [Verrucomicrobiota bacterium]
MFIIATLLQHGVAAPTPWVNPILLGFYNVIAGVLGAIGLRDDGPDRMVWWRMPWALLLFAVALYSYGLSAWSAAEYSAGWLPWLMPWTSLLAAQP